MISGASWALHTWSHAGSRAIALEAQPQGQRRSPGNDDEYETQQQLAWPDGDGAHVITCKPSRCSRTCKTFAVGVVKPWWVTTTTPAPAAQWAAN